MDNFSIGIDIVEHEHMKAKLSDKFVLRILSGVEVEIYNNLKSDKRKIEYISSRFAAKEAIFKAFVKGDGLFNYVDISILNFEDTKAPYVVFNKEPSINIPSDIKISISHSNNYSIAQVLFIY